MEKIEKTQKRLIHKTKNRGSKESESILKGLCVIIKDEPCKSKLCLIDKFLSESDNDIFNWFFELPNNKIEYKPLINRIKNLLKNINLDSKAK